MAATVYFDQDCGFCTRSIRWARAFDWLRVFRYAPLQGEEARALRLREADDFSQMVVQAGSKRWGGWRGVKQIVFRLPAFYMILGAAGFGSLWLPFLALGLLSPLGNPLGDATYRWIARNRRRFPGSTCSLERPKR